jgi:hypothetical protein
MKCIFSFKYIPSNGFYLSYICAADYFPPFRVLTYIEAFAAYKFVSPLIRFREQQQYEPPPPITGGTLTSQIHC